MSVARRHRTKMLNVIICFKPLSALITIVCIICEIHEPLQKIKMFVFLAPSLLPSRILTSSSSLNTVT